MPRMRPFEITDFQILSNSVIISWTAPVGATTCVQAASQPGGQFTNVSPNIVVTGSATNFVDLGAATNQTARFYRVCLVP